MKLKLLKSVIYKINKLKIKSLIKIFDTCKSNDIN